MAPESRVPTTGASGGQKPKPLSFPRRPPAVSQRASTCAGKRTEWGYSVLLTQEPIAKPWHPGAFYGGR